MSAFENGAGSPDGTKFQGVRRQQQIFYGRGRGGIIFPRTERIVILKSIDHNDNGSTVDFSVVLEAGCLKHSPRYGRITSLEVLMNPMG
jgi:hypothetical protein